MKRILLSTALLFTAAVASAQTADELVAKNLAAKGGIDKIKAITSLHMDGKLEAQGMTIMTAADQKPGNLIRQSATIQGMTMTQSFDGTQAWQINPFNGRRDPERMGEDDTRDLVDQADFYGPLVDYQQKGSKVEFVGHATVDGDDALQLKVTLKNGDIWNYFLDPDTFLEVRVERLMFVRGSIRDTVSDPGSYKLVNGVYFPFSMSMGTPRNPSGGGQATYSKIEANLPIPDSEFKMPVMADKSPSAPPKGQRDASTTDAGKTDKGSSDMAKPPQS